MREYLSSDFDKYLLDNGILSQLSTLDISQQNDVVERRNQTLLDMVRSMISYSDLPKFLWGYALEIEAYILNSVPTKYVSNTLIELWAGHKPSLQHYRIWRCLAYLLKGNTRKLKTKLFLCYFVGYSKRTKCWLFYDPREHIALVSINTVFLEDDYMMDRKSNDRLMIRSCLILLESH